MHHLGSGIWSHRRLTRGAIFTVMVPATTMTSDCRGVPRVMEPMRSRSTRLAAAAMNSMPQQLVAIGKIHWELLAPQVRSLSTAVVARSSPGNRSSVS
jgi:hypothetical protein